MPTYFNRKANIIRVKLSDGKTFGFAPRRDIFIEKSMISGEVLKLINDGVLVWRGNRPHEEVVENQFQIDCIDEPAPPDSLELIDAVSSDKESNNDDSQVTTNYDNIESNIDNDDLDNVTDNDSHDDNDDWDEAK